MPKMYALHPVELHPGVKAEDFETFVKEEWPSYTPYPGWKTHILKGNRGDREGKYLVLNEIESMEARDRIFPRQGGKSEYGRQFDEAHPESVKTFEKLMTLVDLHVLPYTGYVDLE
jgi:hypothetical protein